LHVRFNAGWRPLIGLRANEDKWTHWNTPNPTPEVMVRLYYVLSTST
jgi:hypothetical protein